METVVFLLVFSHQSVTAVAAASAAAAVFCTSKGPEQLDKMMTLLAYDLLSPRTRDPGQCLSTSRTIRESSAPPSLRNLTPHHSCCVRLSTTRLISDPLAVNLIFNWSNGRNDVPGTAVTRLQCARARPPYLIAA